MEQKENLKFDFYGVSFSMFEKEPEITQEERDTLMYFNTKQYWHCYYNPYTKKLYNEYGYGIMDDAYGYLLDAKLINKDNSKSKTFQPE